MGGNFQTILGPMRKGCFAIAAVLIGVLVAVALTSLAWRMVDKFSKPRVRKDLPLYKKSDLPGIKYEHIPGARGEVAGIPVSINSLGFRGPEFTAEKAPGVVRIAVVGDSFIFGQGVKEEASLPRLIETLLNQGSPGRYQVINAGTRGYNTLEEDIYLRARVMPLKPEGVILGITEVDDLDLQVFRPRNLGLEKAKQSFWWRLAPVRAVLALRAQQEYLKDSKDYVRNLYDPGSETWKKFVESLTDIRDQCRENHAWLLVITFPLFEDGDSFAQERAQLHRQLTELGIDYVDPKPALSRYSWRELVISPKDMHPDTKAQKIFAGLIYDKLKSSAKLSPPQTPP